MRSTALLLAFPLVLGACLGDYSLGYDQLHVSATRLDGSAVTTSPQNGCVTLPLMLGSRVEKTIRVAAQFDVEVDATRDKVRVSIRGVSVPDARTILAEDLRSSFSDDLQVETPAGETFVVRLRSSCDGSAADASTDSSVD